MRSSPPIVFCAAFLLAVSCALAQPAVAVPLEQTYQLYDLPGLPDGASIDAAESFGASETANGAVYVAGRVIEPGSNTGSQIFVARYRLLGPRDVGLEWVRTLELPVSSIAGIAVDPEGSTYLTGTTSSGDFPTTPSAYQTTWSKAGMDTTTASFVMKIDPAGEVVYATYLGGDSEYSTARAIAVGPQGDAYVSGQTRTRAGFPVTADPISNVDVFSVRLSADGSQALYSVVGAGGSELAVDGAGNAYFVDLRVPDRNGAISPTVTPDSYQPEASLRYCYEGPFLAFHCAHQYVGKLNPTGTALLFGTYVSGTFGESEAHMEIDAAGDVYLTGTTRSYDYPVTAEALQRTSNAVPLQNAEGGGSFEFVPVELPQIAYLSKLRSDGSQLLYSTLLGGSIHDEGVDIRLNPPNDAGDPGAIYVQIDSQSPDLPGLPDLGLANPQACRPQLYNRLPVVLKIDPVTFEIVSSSITLSSATGLHLGPDGELLLLVSSNRFIGLSSTRVRSFLGGIRCLADSADLSVVTEAAPGQLLTVFGDFSASGIETASFDSQVDQLPRKLGPKDLRVEVNNVPAAMIYASETQINFVMPIEVNGLDHAEIMVRYTGEFILGCRFTCPGGPQQPGTPVPANFPLGSMYIPVVPASPKLYSGYRSGYPACGGEAFGSRWGLVLNADGTVNSCDNPAEPESAVTVFLNGAEIKDHGLVGRISTFPFPGAPGVASQDDGLPVESLVGSPYGVWRVEVPVQFESRSVGITVDGNTHADTRFYVWVRPLE